MYMRWSSASGNLVGYRVGANVIRSHYEVVAFLARVFRSLRVDATVGPMRLFAEVSDVRNNQRPDILLIL